MSPSSFKLLALAGLVSLVKAQASALDLAIVDAGYVNSGFAAATNTGFGVDLKSTALLTVEYGFGAVENGNAYTATQVEALPTFTVTPAAGAEDQFSSSSYTLMLADAAAINDADPEGNYRHYLANSATGSPGSNGSFTPTEGDVVTTYAGPGPNPRNGVHRYAWLLFTQPADFTAPASPAAGAGAGHWNVSSYVEEAGLTLVAASYFTVVNGAPSVTGGATTTPVNTASIAAALSSASSSAPASSGSSAPTSAPASTGSQSPSSSAPSSSAPSATPTGAASQLVSGSFAVVAGIVGLVALA